MSKPTPAILRLSRYVLPYGFWVALTVAASLGVAAIDIAMGKWIEGMADNLTGSLLRAAAAIAAMALAGVICKYVIKYASSRFSVFALRDLRSAVASHLTEVPVSEMEKRHSGDLVSRLTNDTTLLQTFFIHHFANLFYMPVVFVSALVLLFLTSWKLILASLVLLPVGIAVTVVLSRPIQSYSERLQEKVGQLNAIAQDAVGGIAVLRAFHMQKEFLRRYKLALEDSVRQSLKLEKRKAAMAPVSLLLLSSPIVLVIAAGGYLIERGELTAGNIILFLYLLAFVLQPLSMLPVLQAQMGEAAGAARRLFEILDLPKERQPAASPDGRAEDFPAEAEAAVEFDNVSFGYAGQTNVLDRIAFRIRPGETVAVVGPSGGGKSTLFKLLCGFYELDFAGGRISMFGRPLEDWPLEELRSRIAVVTQETFLFPATVAENIGFGREGAQMADIVQAAKEARAHEFIERLPRGYDTETGERGGLLSGGQKQRIAIARALLKDAPLLLLDEPTSALDTHAEAGVQEALERIMEGRTVVVIAHRLSTIRRADRILVLDEGRIVESGTHEGLLQQDGLYRKWAERQFAESAKAIESTPEDIWPQERGKRNAVETGT